MPFQYQTRNHLILSYIDAAIIPYSELLEVKTKNGKARLEPEVKEKTEKYFKSSGLSTSQAVNLFLNQVILFKGLPCDVGTPNEEAGKVIRKN